MGYWHSLYIYRPIYRRILRMSRVNTPANCADTDNKWHKGNQRNWTPAKHISDERRVANHKTTVDLAMWQCDSCDHSATFPKKSEKSKLISFSFPMEMWQTLHDYIRSKNWEENEQKEYIAVFEVVSRYTSTTSIVFVA